MSYYISKKNGGQYELTNHALMRIKQRLHHFKGLDDHDIRNLLTSITDDAILEKNILDPENNILINYEYNIKMIVTNNDVIITVIKI